MKDPWVVKALCCCCKGKPPAKSDLENQYYAPSKEQLPLEEFKPSEEQDPHHETKPGDSDLSQMAVNSALRFPSPSRRSRASRASRDEPEQEEDAAHQPSATLPPPSYDSVMKGHDQSKTAALPDRPELPATETRGRVLPTELPSPVAERRPAGPAGPADLPSPTSPVERDVDEDSILSLSSDHVLTPPTTVPPTLIDPNEDEERRNAVLQGRREA